MSERDIVPDIDPGPLFDTVERALEADRPVEPEERSVFSATRPRQARAADAAMLYGVPTDLRGHQLVDDPPIMSSMRRLTCKTCGRAVIVRPNRTTYGSATEYDCTGGSA